MPDAKPAASMRRIEVADGCYLGWLRLLERSTGGVGLLQRTVVRIQLRPLSARGIGG